MESSQWENWNHLFCSSFVLNYPSLSIARCRSRVWSRPICICGRLYFKFNGIDAVNEITNLELLSERTSPIQRNVKIKLRWEVIVRFVDIGGNVQHHCFNSLFIIYIINHVHVEAMTTTCGRGCYSRVLIVHLQSIIYNVFCLVYLYWLACKI